MPEPSNPTLTHRATRAAWWSAAEIAARYGVQFVVMVVLARLLQPSDFGLMAMLLVFTTFAALLAEGGLGSALIQKQSTTANDETSVFLVNLCAGSLLGILLWMMASPIADFYAQPRLVPLLHLMVCVLPLGAMAAVPNAVLTQRLDFRTRATAELLASLCSGLLALWLAWRGYGVWSLAWQAVAGAGLRALLLWMFSGWWPSGRFDRHAFAGLFRFGGFLLLANVLNVAALRLQSLLIGRLFDARALGFYSMAQDTQQAPAQFINGLLNRVGLPMLSAVAGQPAKLAGALRLSLRLSMFVFAPCMAAIAVFAEPLIVALYGKGWEPAAPILAILALAAIFWPLHVLNLVAIAARGRSDLVLKLELAKSLVSIPLVLIASPFGVMAVAWAVLASSLACVIINTWYSRVLLDCGLQLQLRDLMPIFFLILFAVSVGLSVKVVTHGFFAGPLIALGSLVAFYVAGAAFFRLRAWRELVEFLLSWQGRTASEGRSR